MGVETDRLRRADLRLVPIAAATWGAAGVAVLHADAAAVIAGIVWSTTAALVTSAWVAVRGREHPRRSRWGAVLALAAVASALAGTATTAVAVAQPMRAEALELHTGGGRSVVVTATVSGSMSRTASGGVRFDARAHSIRIGKQVHLLSVPITVQLPAPAPLGLGDQIEVPGTVVPGYPGKRAVFLVRGTPKTVVLARANGPLAAAASMRRALIASTTGLPQPAAGLIPGLAVGDTTEVTSQLDADMKASSLTHLTAVSGANCAIVVGIAFGLAALCGARRAVRVASALAALAAFVVLVTPEPSVVRAAVMAAIAMLALLLGRARLGIALLLLAVAVSLILDPWLASSLGFALSVAATGALLVLARPLASGLARYMPRMIALALSIPLAAQLACGPLLVLIAPTVPVWGVVANMLAEPAAPAATVLGLVAAVASPIPVLQAGFVALTWVPAAWIAETARLFGSLPGHAMPWLTGVAGAVLLALLGAGIVWLAVPAAPGRAARRLRVGIAAAVSIVLGVWAGVAALDGPAAPLTVPRDWAVAMCDIGQGDAILLRSAGRVALIDTGPDDAALSRCLSRFGVAHLDLLVLTHYDKDHAGAADSLVGRADVLLHGPVDKPSSAVLLSRFAAAGAQLADASVGMRGALGDATWTVLWPQGASKGYPPGNESCIVLDVRGPRMPMGVFLCDTDESVQAAIVRSGALRPPYDLVKVAHHGSADQDPALYAALRAPVAFISVGADNDYGHPRAPTLEFLAAYGADIHRTDLEGYVTASATDDGRIALWHQHAATAPAMTAGR